MARVIFFSLISGCYAGMAGTVLLRMREKVRARWPAVVIGYGLAVFLAARAALAQDRAAFFEQFTQDFFSAHGVLQVSAFQRAEALALCEQSAQHAALACMEAFDSTDFREDLKLVTVPTLVIHGDADAIVPIEGSGLRTHRAIAHSQLVRISGAPHGLNVSHAAAFNAALLSFLQD